MTTPSLFVRINYSENRAINESGWVSDEFYPIDEVNLMLRSSADFVAAQDGGYDKTGFTLMVFDGSDDDLNEYTGRIDLGNEQAEYGNNIIQEHISQYAEYILLNKSDYPASYFLNDEGKNELAWWLGIVNDNMATQE